MIHRKGNWGGPWTELKLDAFEKYISAYLTIMNRYRDKYGWELIYFDGFAGSGSRGINQENGDGTILQELFDNGDIYSEELSLYAGAAERVLKIRQRGFDYCYFIDNDPKSSEILKKKLSTIAYSGKTVFKTDDANRQIKLLAETMHRDPKYAAMVLLDPFGMQIAWDSIKALSGTKTDLWILIPTGVIVNRLLDKKGNLKHMEKLCSFFGMEGEEIKNYFYKEKTEMTLFGEYTVVEKISKPIQHIVDLYIARLQKEIFKEVTEKPLILYNSRNIPIFHFVFASNNAAAKKIASNIIGKSKTA